jgi:uncharacterized protein (TIGR02466 family)
MPVRAWFSTFIYAAQLQPGGAGRLNEDLAEQCTRLRAHDGAGRRWSAANYRGGFTSYASLSQLHRMSSTFARLEARIAPHVRRFARQLDLDLRGRRVFMTDCWINIMPEGAAHGLHLHPLAFISGTYYVRTPPGSPGLKFEDPRLDRFMAAPPREPAARPANQSHVVYPARAGGLILFESWLRHEVAPTPAAGDRISISFNYNWA